MSNAKKFVPKNGYRRKSTLFWGSKLRCATIQIYFPISVILQEYTKFPARDFMIKMNLFTFSQKLLEITKHTLKYMTGGVQESSLLGFVSLNLDCSCRILVTVTPPCHDYSTVRVFPIIYTHCSLWLSTQF